MSDTTDKMQELARAVEVILPPNTGFVVLAFDFGPDGRLDYVSNAERADVIKVMREFMEKTERGWGTHVGTGPEAPH